MKDILCASDLTPASDIALQYSLHIADRAASQVTLLHVVDNGGSQGEKGQAMMSRLVEQVERVNGTERVRKLLLEGNFMERIAEESGRDHALVVLGTHGPRGLRQTLFGADILKLVRKLHSSALVVQENTSSENAFDRIVLPVAAHDDIDRLMDVVCTLARLHASEVHVYQLLRPNEQPSDHLLKNKVRMLARLESEQVRHLEVNEPSTVFSVSFAEPTIRYAERIKAGCIAIMSHASDDHRYIADAEKERMMTNGPGIPILCA